MSLSNITRYAITKVNKDGLIVLASANQGRNHFDTEEQATKHLALLRANNSNDNLKYFADGHPEKLAVRAIECYHHGDAIGTVFGYDPTITINALHIDDTTSFDENSELIIRDSNGNDVTDIRIAEQMSANT